MFRKTTLAAALTVLATTSLFATPGWAGDDRAQARAEGKRAIVHAPPESSFDFTTTTDNQDNAGSGNPDNDMGVCLFRADSNAPIEFDITLPNVPIVSGGTLRMEVFDVDTNTIPGNPEVDEVYVNGTHVGVLNGSNGTTGVNIFAIPPGVLVPGNNRVMVDIDTTASGSWCVAVNWGTISLRNPYKFIINRGWIAPVGTVQGDFINIFAETSGNAAKVARMVFRNGDVELATLTDADGDGTYSGQYQVMLPKNIYHNINIRAYDAAGKQLSAWPMLVVREP